MILKMRDHDLEVIAQGLDNLVMVFFPIQTGTIKHVRCYMNLLAVFGDKDERESKNPRQESKKYAF